MFGRTKPAARDPARQADHTRRVAKAWNAFRVYPVADLSALYDICLGSPGDDANGEALLGLIRYRLDAQLRPDEHPPTWTDGRTTAPTPLAR